MFILYPILGILALLFLIFFILVALRPANFTIERAASIAAPAPAIYALIEDLHLWTKWSPWEKIDPSMQRTFTGTPKGQGASYAWSGNKKAGQGIMTITSCTPAESIVLRLQFIKPFPANNEITFRLTPEGPATRVTWTMTGKNNFMAKAFCMFMDMDKLVGTDFEKGLANLNTAVGTAK